MHPVDRKRLRSVRVSATAPATERSKAGRWTRIPNKAKLGGDHWSPPSQSSAACARLTTIRGGTPRRPIMRWLYMAVICIFAAVVIIFAFQNLHLVTMSFLGFSARVPLALLAAGIYLLGTVTGGSLLALLRQSFEGAKRRPAGAP
jgi:uncharacterized integral membrane protein